MSWSTGKYCGIAAPNWGFPNEGVKWETYRFGQLVWHSLNFWNATNG